MPELPHNLPHLYLPASGKPESYISKTPPPKWKLPQRDRVLHATALGNEMAAALSAAEIRRSQREQGIAAGSSGFYLDFVIPSGSENATELLENRRKHIELVAVRQESDTDPALATIFVPDTAADHFLKKVESYRAKDTKKGRPKNQELIARIEHIALAAVKSLFTDDLTLFPAAGEQIWWEAWIRPGQTEVFDTVTQRLNIPVQDQRLSFPDREVRLVYGDEIMIARLFVNSNAIAELRRAKDTPALFVSWSNVEQAEWATDLISRLIPPSNNTIAVCFLDTGVTSTHPLIAPALNPADVHLYDPTWPSGDNRGHGTNMAGTTVYGDLMPLLNGNGPVPLTHYIESVKMLPDQGENEPRLYGAITKECVARAEIQAPLRKRAVCMAITSSLGTNRGRPSSWSAAVDQLCFGDETTARLILLSAGNVRENLSKAGYPIQNEIQPIENPAQAWNALTVGAYTEKTVLTDPSFEGWQPVAQAGDLSPTSRTSVSWEREWPIKPDIVLEGGNWAALDDQFDCPDDLGILTTYRDPTIRHFDIFRDTSAATAVGGNLAGRILAVIPNRWPETIRGLLVHSAEWTPIMRQRFVQATSEQAKRAFLRKYGYGVPSYSRALYSATNDLTLIAEDTLQPFWKDPEDGVIKNRHMNLHQLPWPTAQLEQLGGIEVELRITLSYYIEPNPGERGWLRRHRYQSHSLRFAVKRTLESVSAFRARINKAVIAEEQGLAVDTGPDNWSLGRIRNVGSVHSDYWYGTAADLAKRAAIGVYPIGGWWKENPGHHRFDQKVRYALIVSIRAVNGTIDIYTPVRNQITTPVEINAT